MESVRALIVDKYKVRSAVENPVPIPSWNRYPCDNLDLCKRRKNDRCVGYVSVFVDTEKVKWLYIEISFFRDKQRAFIRTNALQTQKLFELGIIPDEGILDKEVF
jgi:hypothetical protein